MNFDEIIDRRGTQSAKWDKMEAIYGVPAGDGMPMWVADMDFRPPECVQDALTGHAGAWRLRLFRRRRRLSRRDPLVDEATRHGWEVEPDAHLDHPRAGQRHGAVRRHLDRAWRRRWCSSPPSTTPSPASSAPRAARSESWKCPLVDGPLRAGFRRLGRADDRPRADARPLLAAQSRRAGLDPGGAGARGRVRPAPRPDPGLGRDPPRPRPARPSPHSHGADRGRFATGW